MKDETAREAIDLLEEMSEITKIEIDWKEHFLILAILVGKEDLEKSRNYIDFVLNKPTYFKVEEQ